MVRAQKKEQLDAWWVEHCRVRALHIKVVKGLNRLAAKSSNRRKRLYDAVDNAVERASVAAVEDQRRKLVRGGGACARTRAGGVHMVGASPSECGKRKDDGRWEAGDRRSTAAWMGSGGSGGGGSGSGGAFGPPSPLPPPSLHPSPPPPAGGRVTRRQVVTLRWQPYALGQFSSAVRRSRDDGVT